jgi:hypothetical protein
MMTGRALPFRRSLIKHQAAPPPVVRVPNADHWLAEERLQKLVEILLDFFAENQVRGEWKGLKL